eukprot:c20594_g1_i1.p1 GENE.c20594_g1_i1~~c20594_g1_i1.p1  ORF type:complete len:425 (+),score=87.46 c20594_g1_i1:144-1418(+)
MGDLREDVNVIGDGVLVHIRDCSNADGNFPVVSGKVAVVDDSVIGMVESELHMHCLELNGALAVVRVTLGNVAAPGMTFYWNQYGLRGSLNIPVVQSLKQDMKDVVHALKAHERVTIQVTPDSNPWTHTYRSAMFIILFRTLLPGLNMIGIWICVEAIVIHYHRLFVDHGHITSQGVRQSAMLMLAGSVIQLESCTVRAVYFLIGPIFSSPHIFYPSHFLLIVTTMGTDMLTTMIAVSLFLRWGAFGTSKTWFKRHLEKILVCVGLLNVISAHVLGWAQAYVSNSVVTAIFVSSVIVALSLIVCGVAFVVSGWRFVKLMQASIQLHNNQQNVKRMRKAVLWIVCSGFFLLVQLIGTVLAAATSLFYDLHGHFATFFLIFLGLTCSGVAQAFAFRPFGTRTKLPTRISSKLSRRINKLKSEPQED